MFESLIDAVRREASGERALEHVRALARFHRVQASPGYDRAAAWLVERIEEAGLTAEIEHVPADGRTRLLGAVMPQGWECRQARAVLHDGGDERRLCDYAELKLSLILRSAPAQGRFPLALLEDGAEPAHYQGVEVRGRVVLTAATDVHRVHRLAVVERGAAGLLACGRRLVPPARDAFTDPDSIAYTSFWWGPDEPRGWGFVISPREGQRLRERLRSGAAPELEVSIEARAFDTTIPLVSARHTTRGEVGGDEIVVISHLCHPQPSANDNGSGVAANLEAARVLETLRARGALRAARRSIRHLWVPEFTGTYAWFGARAERRAQVAAAVNLDMVGEDQEACGSTFLLEHPPCFAASFAETLLGAIRDRAADATPAYAGVGQLARSRMAEVPFAGGSDHAVFVDPAIGIPCPMLIQWPDRYYHSSLDTPDRCDPRSLALAVRCAAVYAGWLSSAGRTEIEALAGAIARRARVRLLAAVEHAEPARATEAERVRARAALRSVARLAAPAERAEIDRSVVAPAVQALEAFAERETVAATEAVESRAVTRCATPRRRLLAPLQYQRWLIEGIERLTAEERERWRALDHAPADLALVFELAWMACDGVRDVDAIERLVWLESGRHARESIVQFFEWTARLGLSDWVQAPEGPWNSRETGTVTS